MSEREEDVISNIRAIIISCKGGLRIQDVENDYWQAFGRKVPIREMGYTSLTEFFEKNPSEFYVIGDMVDAVLKSSSAHIRSLVSRQKSKRGPRKSVNIRQPKKKQPSETYVTPPRFRKENSLSTSKGPEYKADSIGKITLRKPKISTNTELIRSILLLNKPLKGSSTSSENTRHVAVKTELITKAEKLTITSKNQPQVPTSMKCTDTFENIAELPIRNFSQSRLLRLKAEISQELKSQKTDIEPTASTKPSEAKDMFFDIKSIRSTPPSGPHSNEHRSTASQKQIQDKYTHQKAQARIAHLQQSMKTLVKNMNKPSKEINNKKKKSNLKTEMSKDQKNNSMHSFEKSKNGGPKMKLSETPTDYVGSDCSTTTLRPPSKKVTVNENPVYVKLLKELCNSRGFYDPSYKIIVRQLENQPKYYYICKVQIEDYLQMSSYPIEMQDPLSAKELAAKKMYNYCVSDATFRKKNKDEETLISRVMDIVSSTYGVWSDKLPYMYNKSYQEKISDDWFKVISASPLFEIENYDPNRSIVRKKTERSIIDIETLQRFQSIQIGGSEYRNLPDLELPKSVQWGIYITNINNADEVWCRLIGEKYSDAYDSMMTKLELDPPKQKPNKAKIGGLYCIKVSAIWYRIRLIEWVNDFEGLAFYIDVGDKDVVSLGDLYEPDEYYFSVAPQAVIFSLFELGCFSDDEEITSYITDYLLGNSYIGEIITELSNSKCDSRRIVRLWDTSTDEDINVNQVIVNNIIKSIRSPSVPQSFQIRDVVVTSISENGEIFVQTEQKSVYRLNCIILNEIKALSKDFTQPKTDNTIGTDILYLTKCPKNGKFCRVKLAEIQKLNMVDVFFIDYGFIQRKAISDLTPLKKSSVLQAIPPQAIKVILRDIMSVNPSVVKKLSDIILNQITLMKVVYFNQDGLPSVEFYKRSSGDNLLFSINSEVKSGSNLRDCTVPARRKSVVLGLENMLPQNLVAPDIPEVGEHFEVFVTLASSPDLFIVQPLAYRTRFMEMMTELQQMYSNGPKSMIIDDVIMGELYTVLHPDGNWYRGCAQAAVGSCSYSIYMCDFGDCILVTKDKLKPLPEKFRSFPYQAIKATLLGIPPERRDWTPFDCVTFHKLVVEKYFVSTIMEINKDEKNPNFKSLNLILTDTTGEEDIYVHKVLMDLKAENDKFSGF